MKVRVGEGAGWNGDLGVVRHQRQRLCWPAGWLDGEWKHKNHPSGAGRSSVSACYCTHSKQRLTFPEDGRTLKMHTHRLKHIVLLVMCLVSAGQQAEELLVIYRMSQAAGMPGI